MCLCGYRDLFARTAGAIAAMYADLLTLPNRMRAEFAKERGNEPDEGDYVDPVPQHPIRERQTRNIDRSAPLLFDPENQMAACAVGSRSEPGRWNRRPWRDASRRAGPAGGRRRVGVGGELRVLVEDATQNGGELPPREFVEVIGTRHPCRGERGLAGSLGASE